MRRLRFIAITAVLMLVVVAVALRVPGPEMSRPGKVTPAMHLLGQPGGDRIVVPEVDSLHPPLVIGWILRATGKANYHASGEHSEHERGTPNDLTDTTDVGPYVGALAAGLLPQLIDGPHGVEVRGVGIRISTPRGVAGRSGALGTALATFAHTCGEPSTRFAITGGLTADGRVLAVKGTTFKAHAVRRAHVHDFIVPRLNAPEVRKAEPSLHVIAVETFADAVEALKMSCRSNG